VTALSEPPDRYSRHSGAPGTTDQRTPGQKDRDRILYSLAFRRLANVTQVVGPLEGYVFHNRLTHTLEAAQIAGRLAENFRRITPECQPHIDADVVACAAMAHDLGHPPFGHAGEDELNLLATEKYGLEDGFEGNAQSFRIVTRLAELNLTCQCGLDLTRASLNAILKYPKIASAVPKKPQPRKFGAYDSDRKLFEWTRFRGPGGDRQSVEAQIMDLADDIAYSVHDVDDFYRAGLLPIDQFAGAQTAFLDFLEMWTAEGGPDLGPAEIRQLTNLLELIRLDLPYRGTRSERAGLRSFTSGQIGRFVGAVTLAPDPVTTWRVDISPVRRLEIDFLKRLVWVFVIANSRLATVQAGQRRVVRDLVEFYVDAIKRTKLDALPPLFREDAEVVTLIEGADSKEAVRLAIDMVATLADEQATRLARRITGLDVGSIHEHLDS
jgi:dGTPase